MTDPLDTDLIEAPPPRTDPAERLLAEAGRLLADLEKDDDYMAAVDLVKDALAAAYQRGKADAAVQAGPDMYELGKSHERERIRAALADELPAHLSRWTAILDAGADPDLVELPDGSVYHRTAIDYETGADR